MDDREAVDDALGDLDALALVPDHEGQCAARALAQDHHDAAGAGLMDREATVDAVFLEVCRADVTAEVGTVHLDNVVQGLALDLGRHRLAELVAEDERRLLLAVEVAGHLEAGDALHGIGEDADRGQEVDERHLPGGENRPARDRKLMKASDALELAARGDAVALDASAARAHRLAVRGRPAERLERRISLLFSARIDRAKRKRPRLSREEEVLRHVIASSDIAHWIYA